MMPGKSRGLFRILVQMSIVLSVLCIQELAQSGDKDFKELQVTRSDKSLKVPKSFSDYLTQKYITKFREQNPEDEITDAKIISRIPQKGLGVEVFLKQKTKGVLLSNAHYLSPGTGAVIDFSKIVRNFRGSFWAQINPLFPEGSEDAVDEMEVYYIAKTHPRVIDGKTRGSGCNKVLKVTRFFKEEVSKSPGFLVNTTDDRHLTILGGMFLFVSIYDGTLFLSSVTFEDTAKDNFFCKEKTENLKETNL